MQKAAPDQILNTQEATDTLAIASRSGNAIATIGQSHSAFAKKRSRQRGQIVFEYILLLVIAVGAATLLSKLLVSRNADSGGVITNAWARTINTIGSDKID